MDQAGKDDTAELRIGGWLPPVGSTAHDPTQQLPQITGDAVTELIPAVPPQPADLPAHGEPRLPRAGRWALVTAAVAALASVPIALFATSDSAPTQQEVLPPGWPVAPTVIAPESTAASPPAGGPAPDAPVDGTLPAQPDPAAPGGPATGAPTPSASASPQAPVSYEAEAPANRLRGQAARRGHGTASGGQVVGWVGGHWSNTLRFTGVTAPRDGQYRVTIFYVSGERRPATVEVNDRQAAPVDFPRLSDWVTVGTVTVTLRLEAGANTIEFGHPYTWTPDLDRIVIAPE